MRKFFDSLFGKAPISIRWSLFQNMTLLVVLIAGTILFSMYLNANRSLRFLAEKQIKETTDHTETELKRFFQPIYGLLNLARSWGEAGILDPNDINRFNAAFMPILERFPYITTAITCDAQGNALALLKVDNEWRTYELRPAEWGTKVSFIRWQDRKTTLEESWEQLPFNPRERPWYIGAMGLKKRTQQQQRKEEMIAWTKPYSFYLTKDLGIAASTILTRPDGSEFVLAFPITLDDISIFTIQVPVTKNGKAFVVSDEGIMIGLPYDKRFLRYRDRKEVIGDHISEIGVPVVLDALATSRKESSTKARRFKSEGKLWWGNTESFFLGRDQRLHIAVVVPENDFLGDIKKQRNILYAISVLALFFAFILANLLTRKYSQPIGKLVEGSERIRNLDMKKTEPVSSQIKEVNLLADAQERMRTTLQSFSSYIPIDVVKDLVMQGEAAKIGGRTETLTILFTDIENFTTMAEKMEPQALTDHMEVYFQALLEILRAEKATVDKLIGDSIVAFWGAPLPNPEHAQFAARAVLRLRQRVHQLNKKWKKEGKPILPTRFGLATGPVLVGNVGSSERLNYTVLGDTVNLASRLEGINREYGTEIMASGTVKEAAGKEFEWRFVDSVLVKGKQKSVEIFELLRMKNSVDSE